MDEKEREEIRKEAQEILEKFGQSLGKIKLKGERIGKGLGGFRKEGSGSKVDSEFRRQMFANALKSEGGFIIAEKKKWQ